MSYLIDINVISELRKRDRCNPHVSAWFHGVEDDDVFLSVLTIGEVRRGIEIIRPRDSRSARALEVWLGKLLADHAARILPVTRPIAEEWGRFNAPDPLPVIDSLLAATANVHGLTLVTRNVQDVESTGVSHLNPFVSPR